MHRFIESDEPEIALLGGDVTVGVVRVGDTVRRPMGANAPMIHAVLRHLEHVRFDGAPRFLGIDRRGREVLSFVPGEVAGLPRPPWIAEEDRLLSVTRLLRRYDDAMAGFVPPADIVPDWGIPDIALPELPELPGEVVIGHQDITPENVIFTGAEATALIDFDLIKPSSRLSEVLNLLTYWAPLADPADRDLRLREVNVPRRVRLVVDAYGLTGADRAGLVDFALISTKRSWSLMQYRAEHLGGGWARMWDEGIGEVINRRHAWLLDQRSALDAALLG